MRKFVVYLVALSASAPLRADFTYQETAQMTGGSLYEMLLSVPLLGRSVRDPIVSTHILKGNRMATVTKDRVSIMDLDKESITTIDVAKKTYSVMTFAEMKQAMEDAAKRMQNERKEAAPSDPNVQASFKVSVKATGQTKTVQGLNANEMLIEMALESSNTKTGETGAMNITADTWYAPVSGYDEVKEFHKRMAVKLGYVFGSGMQQIMQMSAAQGGQANMNQGFEEVSKELAKIDGVPVESIVKMGGSGAPAGDVSGTQPAVQPQQQEKQNSTGSAIAGAALGRLGGFGGFGRKKKEEPPPAREQPASQAQPGPGATGTLMEMTTSLTSFSSGPADASKFEVPAGYKQVEPDMRRRGR
jgi:hypothetical protein